MSEFTELLGIRVIESGTEESVMEVDLAAHHMSRAQRAHGGVLFSLLDTAMGRAVIMRLPEGRGCATVEIKINFLRPVISGRVRAVARLVYLGRNTAYAEGSVTNEQGKLLSRATGTFFLTKTIEQSERERT